MLPQVGQRRPLLNKYGYGLDYESNDLIDGQGSMDDVADWDTSDARWLVADGYARFLATDDYRLTNKSVISYTKADILKVTFDVAENTATLKIINQAQTEIKTDSTYEIGSHTVIFRPTADGTGIGFRGIGTDPFRIDNLVVTKYEAAPISPKMTSAAPTKDTLDRDLIFVGQAKYPLMKVNSNTLAMPDRIGELFDACEEIMVNDWYDVNGDGNDIAKANIVAYETGKQYYNGELIIVKKDEFYNR